VKIDLWLIPVLVMAGLVVLEFAVFRVRAIIRGGAGPTGPALRKLTVAEKGLRTAALALVSAVGLVILWVVVRALGTSTAANLASIASAICETVSLWLTGRAFQDLKAARRDAAGHPEAPAAPGGPDAAHRS
jgi:hypothetical protein